MKIISKIEDVIIDNAPLYPNTKTNVMLYFIINYLVSIGDINLYSTTDKDERSINLLFDVFSEETISIIEKEVEEKLYLSLVSLKDLFLEELDAHGYIIEGEKNFFGKEKFEINDKGLSFIHNITNKIKDTVSRSSSIPNKRQSSPNRPLLKK